MILFIGAYSGNPRENIRHLAAARKIGFILTVLSEVDRDLVLVNSAPVMGKHRNILFDRVSLANGVSIPVIEPRTYPNTRAGRIINLIQASSLVDCVVERYGVPDLVWCYNGRAFASLIGGYCKRKYRSMIITEFEDWHFARRSVYNPIALIDWLLWRINIQYIDYGFVVNGVLAGKLNRYHIPSTILPGVVFDSINDASGLMKPFSSDLITVGYFGGLSYEKGAGFLLKLIGAAQKQQLQIKFIITGNGELVNGFEQYSREYPEFVCYLGIVSEEDLADAVASVDVILNPHSVNKGIFPFKVLEGVASGRLVISSLLSSSDDLELDWLNKAIVECPLDTESFLNAILNSRQLYSDRRNSIMAAMSIARNRFSKSGLLMQVNTLIDNYKTGQRKALR